MNDKDLNTLFIGQGWKFPPTFVKNGNSAYADMVYGETDINQCLEVLLGTTVGERIMHPKFGCNLREFLFQPISNTTKTLVKDIIETAILHYEPRIDVLSIELNTETQHNGVLLIEVNYQVRSTNSRSNYVYPFYLEEGTNT